MKEMKRKLSLRILMRFFVTLVIFTGVLIGCFLGAMIFGSSVVWYPGPVYNILRFMLDHTAAFFGVCWVAGFIAIFARYWIKTLGYLENIIQATEAVYRSENELILLPEELKEVENQMNRIKLNVKESERAARESEQRKNDLIVYLAHDLKTPLTSVIGYLTLLRDEGEISPELQEKYLSISLEKAERLEDLINEFFEITRFNLTTLTLELSRVNLTRMLEQIIYEFKPALDERNLLCELVIPSDLMCRCDVNKMQRVFDNVLRNAIHYCYEGSTIHIIGERAESGFVLCFGNRGDTISEEKLARVFEQFYRLDTARTSKTGGAGLGLSIAKEIVELHGGTIVARSENETVEFEIVIPDRP